MVPSAVATIGVPMRLLMSSPFMELMAPAKRRSAAAKAGRNKAIDGPDCWHGGQDIFFSAQCLQ